MRALNAEYSCGTQGVLLRLGRIVFHSCCVCCKGYDAGPAAKSEN